MTGFFDANPVAGGESYNLNITSTGGITAGHGVPDGGSTIVLLGLAMTAVAGASRKFRA